MSQVDIVAELKSRIESLGESMLLCVEYTYLGRLDLAIVFLYECEFLFASHRIKTLCDHCNTLISNGLTGYSQLDLLVLD